MIFLFKAFPSLQNTIILTYFHKWTPKQIEINMEGLLFQTKVGVLPMSMDIENDTRVKILNSVYSPGPGRPISVDNYTTADAENQTASAVLEIGVCGFLL